MMQHILNCIGSTVITVIWGKDSGGMSNNQQKPQVGVIPKGKGHREEVKGAFKDRENLFVGNRTGAALRSVICSVVQSLKSAGRARLSGARRWGTLC